MKVRAVYTPTLIRAEPRETLAQAAERMVENEVGALAVFRGQAFEGIITERDVVRAIATAPIPGQRTSTNT
ncbi:MAG TPA: CBS domain-containing protein [Actinomycetota bacterium]|nr:CBS domain-containing protein [Actinomycetota bacterium]